MDEKCMNCGKPNEYASQTEILFLYGKLVLCENCTLELKDKIAIISSL